MSAKAKAAPIARPSLNYEAELRARDYTQDQEHRARMRQLEAEARQKAREAGITIDLGKAEDEWKRAAKYGTSGPPTSGSGRKRSSGTGKGKGGKGGKAGKKGKGGKGKEGKGSKEPARIKNAAAVAAIPAGNSWGAYKGPTSSAAARPASELGRIKNSVAVAAIPDGNSWGAYTGPTSAVVKNKAAVASVPAGDSWGKYKSTQTQGPEASEWEEHKAWKEDSGDQWRTGSEWWNDAKEASWSSSWNEGGNEWNSQSWDETWDAAWNDSSDESSCGADECDAQVPQHSDADDADVQRTRMNRAPKLPDVFSGLHCEVLKHSSMGCAVVNLESRAARDAALEALGGTGRITIDSASVDVQRHRDKSSGAEVSTSLFVAWGAKIEKQTPVSAESIAAAFDHAVIDHAAASANAEDLQRRKLTSYLWHMAAKGEVEKGKAVLLAAMRAGQLRADDIEGVITEFDQLAMTEAQELERGHGPDVIDLTDEAEDTDHVASSQLCTGHINTPVPDSDDDDAAFDFQ